MDKEKDDNSNHSTIIFLLGTLVFVFVIYTVSDWQNRDANARYHQNLVEDYDAFYSDCKDYFSKNNLIDTAKASDFYREKIIEEIAFEKEIKLYDQEKTNDERFLGVVCEELQEFSRNETRQVIHDIDYPSREQKPQKECDGRGCVYYE